MLKRIFYLLLYTCAISSVAQETPAPESNSTSASPAYEPLKKDHYWFNPHASVSIPNPMNNTAFKKNFAGVYEINAGMDINVFKGLFVGAAYKNATLKITGLIGTQNFHYNPLMKINNAGIRVGGKTFIGSKNRIIYSLSFLMGQSWTHYTELRCKDSTVAPALTKYITSYIEPEMSIYFLVESNFAVGATVSYGIYRKNFDPYEICLDGIKPVGPIGSGSTQIFSFGFSFCYSFLKKKE